MRWTRSARSVIGLVVAVLWLAACGGPSRPVLGDAGVPPTSPTVEPSPLATLAATPSPSPSTAVSTGTPTPTHPVPTHPAPTRPVPTAAPKRDATPQVGRVTISPTYIPSAPCGKLTRPMVTAKVTDADDPPTALQVTLDYYLSRTYQGTVRMSYDASRGLFVYRLPGVDAKAGLNTMNGGILDVTVTVRDPAGLSPRPEPGGFASVQGCPPPIGNG